MLEGGGPHAYCTRYFSRCLGNSLLQMSHESDMEFSRSIYNKKPALRGSGGKAVGDLLVVPLR